MGNCQADEAFDASLRTVAPSPGGFRVERDGIGERNIPEHAYWGINVARALDNFRISGRPISIYTDLIFAYASVKQACARANAELGELSQAKADLIDRACEEIKAGQLHDQFVVDIMQGGAGTSTNMNFNEVIANRGLELAGAALGEYDKLSPNDDVNKGQSTNDTYPTALKLGLCLGIERYLEELEALEAALDRKAAEFARVLKVGRTQLMDAVPMTVGQEFAGFAETLRDDHARLAGLIGELGEINLGGTAIGTGIAAHHEFAEAARRHLSEISGFALRTAPDLIEATTDVAIFLDVSAALKRSAMKLSKICNDLRLLNSGPQAGLAEIRLPARQAGSSIMPGKVNPVIPEVVNEIAFVVAGADVTVTMAAEAGQLQLNAFEPVMAYSLFNNLQWLCGALQTLRVNCIEGIEVNEERLRGQMETFVGIVTALVPHIGYDNAAILAKKALDEQRNIADLVVESGMLSRERVAELMTPENLTTNAIATEP